MSEADLEVVEVSIEQSRKLIQRKADFEKLLKNPEFKTIILEGYFEKESQRLVMLKADHNMQSDESQREILKQIDAIGTLRQYFHAIRIIGNQAEKAFEQDSQTRDEMLEEGLEVSA